MSERKFYRDGLEEIISGPVRVVTTREGHTVERYKLATGKRRYFVTLSDTHWCAHGDTLASAIADALWKDPAKRPTREALVKAINDDGVKRKITLSEFRLLTGACSVGCQSALAKAGRDDSPLTAYEIRDLISVEWGNQLLGVLGWSDREVGKK